MDKIDQQNSSSQAVDQTGSPKYWMSLEQWRKDDTFKELAEKEFQSSPHAPDDTQSGGARRDFLKLMGASMALTTFGCVRRPAQKIVPYVNRPEGVINGISNYYSSTIFDGSQVFGSVVKTREGRPFKLEGNSLHPLNGGALSARAHAVLLNLYDPDRFTSPKRNLLNEKKSNRDTVSVEYEALDETISAAIKKGNVALVTGSLVSPATRNLVREFSRSTGAKTYTIDNVDNSTARSSQMLSYGSTVTPRYRIARADVIVSIACDFLGTYLSPVSHSKEFASRRSADNMNKLYSFEGLLSLTGMNADERFQIRPSQQLPLVMGLLKELLEVKKVSAYANDSRVKATIQRFSKDIDALELPDGTLRAVADELWASRGKSLVLAGGLEAQTEKAQSLQVAVNFLNSILGNDGKTIDYSNATFNTSRGGLSELKQFVRDVESGNVKTVIFYGVNPAYTYSESFGFHEALKNVNLGIYVGDRNNETARMCDYLVPDDHQLENWGDAEVVSGVYSIQQPTIRPLYNTRSFQNSMMVWANASGKTTSSFADEDWYEYLRNFWKNQIWSRNRGKGIASKGFDDFWYELLQKGVFDTSSGFNSSNSGRSFRMNNFLSITPREAAEKELVLYETAGVGDGSLANVPWLQEFPDPVTKICWDNYLTVSPKDAHDMHLSEGDIVKVSSKGKTLEVPAHIQPGQKPGVYGLAIGYGRKGAGKVADGVGVNAYVFADFASSSIIYSGMKVDVSKTSKSDKLANIQGHHTMEGRQIIIEATLDQYKKNPEANIHRHKIITLWKKHEYKGHKWGMAIDLNACNGCSACMIACQSENNIPVVGKKYVLQGRIMCWIRVDRYYTGDPNDPAVLAMPVTCMHCDNAPCETVCPVAATTHSEEGLNDMIYNRCVGTRYCANNCPYKVRRFNWFNYVKEVRSPMQMAMNPEVTVRSRGVMEKCSFCLPRINEEKAKARREDRGLRDGDVVTACQQTCPTGAITFGDMNDPNSKVSQQFKRKNTYGLLEELNTVPAVRYQTKIRNTDKLKADAHGHGGGH